MQLWSAALKDHPAVKSGEVEVTVFDGNYTALTQQDQINTMITQKYDAIIFVPIDAEAGATPVEAAHDAGIPVIGSNTRVHSDLVDLLCRIGRRGLWLPGRASRCSTA